MMVMPMAMMMMMIMMQMAIIMMMMPLALSFAPPLALLPYSCIITFLFPNAQWSGFKEIQRNNEIWKNTHLFK